MKNISDWLRSDDDLCIETVNKKYLLPETTLGHKETIDEFLYRVSGGDKEVEKIIEDLKFIPGGRILSNRGIVNPQDIEIFLKPTRYNFHDPFLMPDMEIAVDRIIKAIQNKQQIIIYGDYDADGITSTTVLKTFLEERGLHIATYIPNRLDEGYGLNNAALDKIAQGNYDLMITVDCGISAISEIEYANNLGIETIITDHHEPGENIPNALAVVDAKRKDSVYPCRDLAGVGVVFKLIQAISKAKRGKLDRDNLIEELADVMNVLDWIIYICDINCAEIKEMIEFKQNRCISRFLKGEFK